MNWFIIVVLICIIVITQLIYIYLENVVCIREGNANYQKLNIGTLDSNLGFTPLTPYFLYYNNKLNEYNTAIEQYNNLRQTYENNLKTYNSKLQANNTNQLKLNRETKKLNKCSKNFFKKITNSCKNIKKAVKKKTSELQNSIIKPPNRPTMPTLDSSLQNEMALITELNNKFKYSFTTVKSQPELVPILNNLQTIIDGDLSPFIKGVLIWYVIKNSFNAYKDPVIPTTNPGNTHKYNMFLFNTNFKENQNTASIIYQSIQVLLNNNDILYDVYKAHPEITDLTVAATKDTINDYLFIKDKPTFNITVSTIINLIKTTVVNLKSDLDIL